MIFLNRKIFFTLFLAIFLLFFHVIAMKFQWYYMFYELDMFPHFLGGLLIFLSIYNFALIFKKDISISKMLWLVFVATVFWEFFEIYLDNTFGVEYARSFDSLSDICLGMLGAVVGTFLTAKKTENVYNKANGEQS